MAAHASTSADEVNNAFHRVVTIQGETPAQRAVMIAELDIGPQGAAAVAVEPRPRVLRCWDWPASPAPGAARGSSR